MLTNCFRFAPRDSVPGLISKICKYLKEHPGWSVEELKEVIGDIETSLALGEISYFTNQNINDLDTLALYDTGYRFVFIGGGDVYSAMYALEESGGDVVANGVSLGVTESEFNQLKSIVLALNNAAYTATNPPPYPVTKVNNRTGDVKLDLADVLGESTAQTMLMSEINFDSTQLATWNAFYDYGYRVVGVLANDGSAITALYILGQNVGNHAPIPMALSTGGNVISVNGDIGEVFTLRVDPNDPGIPTDPPVPINATTLNGKSASEYALEDTLTLIHDRIYPGVDLTVKFADEIANYSDEWAWITARIKAGNFSGIHVSDYIPVTTGRTDGFTFKAQIAGIDTYYKYSDSDVGHHIDFISKELWPDAVAMNQVNYNNGTANTPYPWLASHCYAYLNSLSMAVPNEDNDDPALADVDYTAGGVLYYLPDKLKNKIVQKRALLGQRYTAGSMLTETNSWGWADIGKLWLPSEIEVYGHGCWANNPYDKGGFTQYPIFANNMNRVKLRSNGRNAWWFLSPYAGNSTRFVVVDYGGSCYFYNASGTWVGVPVCFRIS